jgi:hypothetical protein
MTKPSRYREVAALIETAMPHASHEEKLQASFEFWEFFDAIWAIADRQITEAEHARNERDISVAFDRLRPQADA